MSARDPVCGKEVDPLRARAVGIFGGVTYFFCSADCKTKYADPRRTGGPALPGQPERRKKAASPFAAAPNPTATATATVSSDGERVPASPSGKFATFEPTPLPQPIAAAELAPLDEDDAQPPTSPGLPWRYIFPALVVGALLVLVLVFHR